MHNVVFEQLYSITSHSEHEAGRETLRLAVLQSKPMYESYYGFKDKPFSLTPNPRFLFLSKTHKEVYAHLLYGMIEKGFMVFLVVSNLGQAFAGGFLAPAVMDAAITVWSVLYFISLRRKTRK